jgi:stage II sporulation protein AB (anti-sigma F factor)
MEQKNFDRTRSREVMRLTFDSRSENEEFARVVVAVFVTRMNPTLEEIDDIKTAVSEAVTNAVIHGYQNGEGTILIEAAVEENVLSVTVSDDGVGISNIEKAMEPLYSTLGGERAGLGFAVMQSFMDKIKVTSKVGQGTTVVMVKKISPRFITNA